MFSFRKIGLVALISSFFSLSQAEDVSQEIISYFNLPSTVQLVEKRGPILVLKDGNQTYFVNELNMTDNVNDTYPTLRQQIAQGSGYHSAPYGHTMPYVSPSVQAFNDDLYEMACSTSDESQENLKDYVADYSFELLRKLKAEHPDWEFSEFGLENQYTQIKGELNAEPYGILEVHMFINNYKNPSSTDISYSFNCDENYFNDYFSWNSSRTYEENLDFFLAILNNNEEYPGIYSIVAEDLFY